MVVEVKFKIMDIRELEQRIDCLEQTIEQLADNQVTLSKTISVVTETQSNIIDGQKSQSNDYTALIIYVVGFIATGWVLSTFFNVMNQISNIDESMNSKLSTVDSLYAE